MRVLVVVTAYLTMTAELLGGDLAKVYVYAQRDTAARSWLRVSCDSVLVAELKQGAFFAIEVAPGRYTFSIEKGIPLTVGVQSGEDSFVRLDWSYGIDRPPIPILSRIRETEARGQMKYLSYVNAKRVHSSMVPTTDPSPLFQPQLRTRQ